MIPSCQCNGSLEGILNLPAVPSLRLFLLSDGPLLLGELDDFVVFNIQVELGSGDTLQVHPPDFDCGLLVKLGVIQLDVDAR